WTRGRNGARRPRRHRPGARTPTAARAGLGAALLPPGSGGLAAGPARRGRRVARLPAPVVRARGGAEGGRARPRPRPATAGLRRARRRAGAGRAGPGAGRPGRLAAARIRAAPRVPGRAGVDNGLMEDGNLPPRARAELEAGLDALGLPRALAEPLLAYLALMLRWNRAYNLTAIREPVEMVRKHLLDSLAMHASLDAIAARGGQLADLGTGPGLPGIPLAIAKPGLRVALVESNGKKARFLREALR